MIPITSKCPPRDSNYIAFIDQEHDGSYSPARLITVTPQKNKQRYVVFESQYTGQVHISSYRRNWTHRSIATFKRKRNGGPNKENIDCIQGSFLELDGSMGGIKTREDAYSKCREKNLPTPSNVIETSPGHFHIVWLYERPLPWGPKNDRWWTAQQKRLIQIFEDFGPDVKACINPVQFLRNWTQIDPINFKRKCDVHIDSTKYRTSLGALQRALDKTGIENPRISAETIIRQDLRKNGYINATYKQWAERLGLSERTMARIIPKLIKNEDISIESKLGNNKKDKRSINYKSLIFQEPINVDFESEELEKDSFSEMPLERSKTNLYANARVLSEFCQYGAIEGLRNKTIFICVLYLKFKFQGKIGEKEIFDHLYSGFVKCGISGIEFRRTIKSALKSKYDHPFSRSKIAEWLNT